MYNCYQNSLLYLKPFIQTSQILQLRLVPQLNSSPQSRFPTYSTSTGISERKSFRMNYLVNSCGFSPEIASEISKHAFFISSKTPDSVFKLLRSLNISDSKIRDIIEKAPELLSSDPVNTLLPKLEFFKSKGASTSQLAQIVTYNPWYLLRSLENHIIPCFDSMRRFLSSDLTTIKAVTRCHRVFSNSNLEKNINILLHNGVLHSSIGLLLRNWPGVFNYSVDEFKSTVNEIKALGFDPSKTSFVLALRTKLIVTTSSWERKVKLFGTWGWSDETLLETFMKRPLCMMTSDSKIEAVMNVFVNQMGWDPLELARYSELFQCSLEKRIIPRAYVLQFLQSRGLIMKKTIKYPFIISEDLFLQKYLNCFKDEVLEIVP